MDKGILVVLVVLPCSLCIANLSQTGIENFAQKLLHLRDDVLKVAEFQNVVDDYVRFDTVDVSAASLLKNLSSLLSFKFQERITAVKQLHDAIENSYKRKSWGSWMSCCNMNEESMDYNSHYKTKVY